MHTDTHTPYQGEEQPGFQESFSMFLCLAIVFLSDLSSFSRLDCDVI